MKTVFYVQMHPCLPLLFMFVAVDGEVSYFHSVMDDMMFMASPAPRHAGGVDNSISTVAVYATMK